MKKFKGSSSVRPAYIYIYIYIYAFVLYRLYRAFVVDLFIYQWKEVNLYLGPVYCHSWVLLHEILHHIFLKVFNLFPNTAGCLGILV